MDNVDELPSFEEVCFQPFDTAKALPQTEDLRQWLDVIAGQPQGIFETKTRLGQCAGIEGIVKLKCPWPEDGILKLALEDYNRLQIHFFRGGSGITLVYHEDDLFRWTAYATKRQPRGLTPSNWTLIGTDSHRNRRTNPKNHDQYGLWCHRGEVVISRGDIELVRAPLGGPPDEVYLQGKATFHGLQLVRTKNALAAAAVPDAGAFVRPAERAWQGQLDPQARAELQPDGSLKLTTLGRLKKRSWSATPLPRDSLSELILEMEEATPGAGIYLGNGKEAPRYVLRYATDRRSKQLCLLLRNDDDLEVHEFRGLHESLLPVVASRHWVRLVFGASQLRWSISPDGVHWAEPAEPIRNLPLDITHFGLHGVVREAPIRVTLRQFSVRDLPYLAALAPSELRAQAVAKNSAPSVGAWLADVTETTPAGGDTNAWRRACALKTLAAGTSRVLGNELLWLLLNDPTTRDLPLATQLRVLAETALVMDVWDDQPALQRFIRRYVEAGIAAWKHDGTAPFTAVRRAWMTTPIATRQPLDLANEELLRTELVQLIYGRQWQRLREFSRELRFFQLNSKTPLLDWADAVSLRNSPAAAAGSFIGKQKEEWRDLLVEELNKDVYNALAQLRVELSGAGREDAARAIAGIGPELTQGVAPHWRDEQLLVSLPAAAHEVLRNDSALRQVVNEQFADIARLRLRQAVDQLDEAAVARLAWQFSPTDAAVDARVWLGDRALARGWFALAAEEYRQASEQTRPAGRTVIGPKLRLAATLAGQAAGSPLAGTVTLGGIPYSAEEFEKLLKQLSERDGSTVERTHGNSIVDPQLPSVPAPKAAAYQVHRRARLDGLIGNDPNREFARETARRQVDWVDRQLAIAVDGPVMYVTNRFQVAAYDLQSKQRVWQTAQPGGQIQFAQESPFVRCRPWLTHDRIWVRMLYGTGATLASVDRANGQFLWTATPGLNEEFISDPFVLSGDLLCVKLVRTEQQNGVLRLARFDPRTGNAWRDTELIQLRDSWRRRRCCEVTVLDDGLVIMLGGTLLRLDATGQVLWMRKETILPPDEDLHWIHQSFQAPIAVGRRLYVTQPGSPALECVDSQTGGVLWSRLMMNLERVVAIGSQHLVVQTSTGLATFRLDDGRTEWTLPLAGLTMGVTGVAGGDILAVQRVPSDAAGKRFQPRLLWIDSAAGQIRAAAPLAELEDADPRIGPLVLHQNQIWTFSGRGQNDPTRDVVELSANGPLEIPAITFQDESWTGHVEPRLTTAVSTRFPFWQPIQAETGEQTGLLSDALGEKDVVGLRSRNGVPVVLGRELMFPATGRPVLRLRFGRDPALPWKLEVRFHGEAVWAQEVSAETHPQPWNTIEIDLKQLAGQQGWLTIRASPTKAGDTVAFWKLLELAF